MYFPPNFRWILALSKDILEVCNKYKQPILIGKKWNFEKIAKMNIAELGKLFGGQILVCMRMIYYCLLPKWVMEITSQVICNYYFTS